MTANNMIEHEKSVHPATKIVVAFAFIILIFLLPLPYQAIAIFLGGIIAWILSRPLPSRDPGNIFLRLWLIAGLFLTIIHCIKFDGGIAFDQNGLLAAGRSFFRIGSLMIAFLWLIRTVKAQKLYAMLIDLRLPIPLLYVIFQAIFLMPKFGERAKDILVAQQSRGFVLKGIHNRLKAFILIFAPLFSTMIYELEENAASVTARGLYASGRKSHLTRIYFTYIDVLLITISLITPIVLFIIMNYA